MLTRQLIGLSAAALMGLGTVCASAAPLPVAPVAPSASSYVQHVDCAVGAHIGPLGGCIIGTDNPPPPPPVIVEHRAADVPDPDVTTQKVITQDGNGCATKSVTQTDSAGNSETRTKSNC